ncbi:MAG: hypothetical protein M3O02_08860 [Acidobacteriota bacterium]|nr:hypothetical protein [Acidobacteriota bacterium]
MPPSPLLPPKLGKLTRASQGDAGDGLGALSAPSFDPNMRAVLIEDGLKRFASSDYVHEVRSGIAGAPTGSITVYTFTDASGAVAAYDFLRHAGMRPEKLADGAVSSGSELLLHSGVNVVRESLKLDRTETLAVTNELIGTLPKVGGTAGIAPLLPAMLPAKGLDTASIRYALGPRGYAATGGLLPPEGVGFDKSAETVTAVYKSQGSLTLALYPTPQIAADHARQAESELKALGARAGTVLLRREGPLVVFTNGGWTQETAKAMVESIHLRQELSFDKPMPHEFHAEVQKTYSLLQSIAMFCGIGALAAVILGLFFGGGRALIRVLQGKPAASEPEFLRIDLRGPVRNSSREPNG